MLEYVLNTSTNVFCLYCPRRVPTWGSHEEHLRSFLAVAHHHIGQEGDKVNEGIMFGEFRVLHLVCFRSVDGWMGMDV